jgi:hypothetical protein
VKTKQVDGKRKADGKFYSLAGKLARRKSL